MTTNHLQVKLNYFFKSIIYILFCFYSIANTFSQSKPLNLSYFKENDFINPIQPTVLSGFYNENNFTDYKVKDDSKKLIIETQNFKVLVNKSPFQFRFINTNNRDTFQILSQNQSGICFTDSTIGKSSFIKSVSSINKTKNEIRINTDNPDIQLKIQVIDYGILKFYVESNSISSKIQISAKKQGSFFGGGEHFIGSKLDQRRITNEITDHINFVWEKEHTVETLQRYEPTYLAIPFVLTPSGFGLYLDNAKTSFFELNTNANALNIQLNNNIAVLYLFAEKTPKEVLTSYTTITGRQPAPADWHLGVWVNLLEGRDSVYAKANRLKKWGIPTNAIWIFDLEDPTTCTGWPFWTKGFYGKSRQLTDSLHKLDLKVLTYLHPFVYKNLLYYKFQNPIYDYCKNNKLLLREDTLVDKPSTVLDFYNQKTVVWWKSILKELLINDNFDGWMEDFGDISYNYNKKSKQWKPINYITDYSFSNEVLANLYPLVYHKTTYKISQSLKPDFIGFCRSGSAGSAPFTKLVWGGDQSPTWDKKFGYPSLVSAGISAGLSGYGIWAPDILSNSPSVELWKRWVQFGAFTATMRDHLWANKPKSIKIWTNANTMNYFKRYALIHTALMPYLMEFAKEASKTGIPIIRHMMLEYPNDSNTLTCEYQYMLGSEMIVAPVVEEHAITKQLYLPKGEWVNLWNNEIKNGNRWIEVKVTNDLIPVFIKKNSQNVNIKSFIEKVSKY